MDNIDIIVHFESLVTALSEILLSVAKKYDLKFDNIATVQKIIYHI